jgi:O-antigen/teichoic acid export membrane protein
MTYNSTVDEFATQSSITLFGNIVRTLFGFILVITATRTLGSDIYGVFTLALSIVYVLLGTTNLKIYKAIDYFVPQHLAEDSYREAKGTLVSVVVLSMIGAFIGVLVILLSLSYLAEIFDEPRLATLLLILCLLLPLRSVSRALFLLFTSIKRMDYRIIIEYISVPLSQITIFLK